MNELIQIDCMEYMSKCKDNAFDLAIVDPPYGIGISKKKSHGKRKGKLLTEYKPKQWDNNIPDKKYFNELFRISKNCMIFGANYFVQYLTPSKGWIFWNKMFSPEFSFAAGEFIYTSYDIAAKKVDIRVEKNAVSNNEEKAKKYIRIHPTQKPVALYKWLLQNYAKPGDKLLDTHSGSGSFRIAAYDLGFDLVSCELDPDYCRDNEARFQRHIQQLDLFKPEEIQEKIFTEGKLF